MELELMELMKDKKIFIYGGNLGIPQGLDFLLETITATEKDPATSTIPAMITSNLSKSENS